MASPAMSSLLTAFAPFRGRPRNQSEAVLLECRTLGMLPTGWRTEVLPVNLEGLRRFCAVEGARPGLKTWLALGEGARQGPARLESLGRNHLDLGDDPASAGGGILQGELDPGGVVEIAAGWPAGVLVHELRGEGFEVESSENAGTHACNALLYWGCIAAEKGEGLVGFLHLARQPEKVREQARVVSALAHHLDLTQAGKG